MTIDKNFKYMKQRMWKKIVPVINRMKKQKETEGILWICKLSYHTLERGKEEQMKDDFIFKEVAIDF